MENAADHEPLFRHCKERSDAAVHATRSHGLPRFARNDGYRSHGSPRPSASRWRSGAASRWRGVVASRRRMRA